jgi:hypothetical protein
MFLQRKAVSLGFCLCSSLLALGCASNTPPQSTIAASDQGVTCTKCQVTWVNVPVRGSHARIVGYTWAQRDVCPDCMDNVKSFFTAGKFQHMCKTCGETMEICKAHPL